MSRTCCLSTCSEAVDNGMSMDVAGMVIIQSYQATSGLIKAAAPF